MKKDLARVFFLCAVTLLTTGCWDYTEIELRDFVVGAGVDAVEPKVIVITEMAKSTGTGQEAEFRPVVLTTEARSLTSGAHNLANPSGMEIFWAHAQVFLVSEEVAQGGMLTILEPIIRARDLRSTMYLLVAKDCTVEEVFKSKPPLLTGVSQHLTSIIRLSAISADFVPQQVWQFTGDLAGRGISATLPAVELVHEGGNLMPVVRGAAVFKLDRMIGWLSKEETQILALLKGESEGGFFVMDTEIKGNTTAITYEFRGSQLKTKPIVDGERVEMKVSLSLQLGVAGTRGADVDFSDPAVVRGVEEQVARYFTRRIRDFLRLIQEDYNSDILGFGRLLWRREPATWRKIESDWDAVFRGLPVDVEVDCRIAFTGFRAQPIKMRN